MSKTKNRKGISLIELVVVISIIGIMTVITIVALANSRRNATLNAEADVIIAAIREAQNYALTGKNIDVVGANCHLYITAFYPNDYTVRSGSNSSCSDNGGVKKVYPKGSGVTTSAVASGTPWFGFYAPHAEVGSNIALVGQWRAVTLTKDGKSLYICLNSAGVIKKSSSSACN